MKFLETEKDLFWQMPTLQPAVAAMTWRQQWNRDGPNIKVIHGTMTNVDSTNPPVW